MILANGKVLCDDFVLRKCDLRIENGKIAEIGENLCGEEKCECHGDFILPGFIDTHIHGAVGVRVSTNFDDLKKITQYEATQGVTSIVITTEASKKEEILAQMETIKAAAQKTYGAKIAAIHAEGPFLNMEKKGAMTPENILLPDIELFDRMIEKSGGMLKKMTIAPELEGAESLIRYATQNGVVISLGHTDASFDEAQKAIEIGANMTTHTFNAMRALNHREPGILGAALTDPRVSCEVICDHIHIHPAVIKLIYKVKGVDNVIMISDSIDAAGYDGKEFEVDGIKRYIEDGVIRLADGTIAGSAKSLYDGVKNLIKDGIPIEDVSKMASFNPAKIIGIDAKTGSIKVGKCADLVVLDSEYRIKYTFVDGRQFA